MERLSFLTSKSFWTIAAGVTVLHVAALLYFGQTTFANYSSYIFYEVLPRTFGVTRVESAEGETVEMIYTVPSKVHDLSGGTPQDELAPPEKSLPLPPDTPDPDQVANSL